MKSEHPSDLRQWINILGAQIEDPKPDPMLVIKTAQLIGMAAGDMAKPLPSDVFADGVNDRLARVTLSSMGALMVEMASALHAQRQAKRS